MRHTCKIHPVLWRFALSISMAILVYAGYVFAQSQPAPCPTLDVVGPTSVLGVNTPLIFYLNGVEPALGVENPYLWTTSLPDITLTGQGTGSIQMSIPE